MPFDPAPGWETLLLAHHAPVRGKVRLTKQLALLQLEGFPIPYRFRKRDMGPACLDLVHRAEQARDRAWLRIEQVDLREGIHPREDFVLTTDGRRLVEEVVLPAIHEHDEAEFLLQVLQAAPAKHRFHQPGNALSRYAHQILHWDVYEEFEEAYHDVRDFFERAVAAWQDRVPQDEDELLQAAATELAVEALQAIEPRVHDPEDDDAGKHFVVYNCEELREYLLSDGEDVRELLAMRYKALESVAQTYGYVENLDLSDVVEVARSLPVEERPVPGSRSPARRVRNHCP